MLNARLDEVQTGIKIAGRNINNLRNADYTILMAESEEELKSLLTNVKEESETAGLKPNIQKTKIMASSPITSWEIVGETMETVTDFFLGSKITTDSLEKTLMLGKIEGTRKSRWQRIRWLDANIDMSLSKLPWHVVVHGVTKSLRWLSDWKNLVSVLNEAQVFDILSLKEFSERQSDR